MPALEVLLAVSLPMVCGFGSGFFLARRLGWTLMEKLCGILLAWLVFPKRRLRAVPGRHFAGSSDARAIAKICLLVVLLGFLKRAAAMKKAALTERTKGSRR
jgi:hypothetical protein